MNNIDLLRQRMNRYQFQDYIHFIYEKTFLEMDKINKYSNGFDNPEKCIKLETSLNAFTPLNI
jgi:hypothetical protein